MYKSWPYSIYYLTLSFTALPWTTSFCMSDWLIRDFLNVAPLIYICISCPNTASKRAQKQSCVLTAPSECQSDLKLVLWSRHESVHPWSWNEISAIGEDWCQSSAHNTLKTSWKNVSGTRRSLITVTFRYQIDGSGSWHWTSALLITLRWVGSADQRGGATSWSSHSFREKKSGQQAVRSWWRFSELYFSTWELLENNSESG